MLTALDEHRINDDLDHRLSDTHSIQPGQPGGDERDRTADLLLAKQALSQLSYIPNLIYPPLATFRMVGLDRIELSTSRLSGVRSNHLSYRPEHGSVFSKNMH